MRAYVGATLLCAGLSVALVATGCSTDSPSEVTDGEGLGAEGEIQRDDDSVSTGVIWRISPSPVSEGNNPPSNLIFNLVNAGEVSYSCDTAKVNNCAMLRIGDSVVVAFDVDDDSVTSPGIQYLVQKVEIMPQVVTPEISVPRTPS